RVSRSARGHGRTRAVQIRRRLGRLCPPYDRSRPADKPPNRPYLAGMPEQPRVNIPEWSVSELSAALKRTVEDAYGFVRVRGEISGYRGPHSSGHCYFSLKDEGARIEAVIWRTAFGRMRIKPQECLEVIVSARLT